ncbi:GNAT family N-acetyltransferase [Desulfosediminicola ganghwensis]|uniref:GNAT family N-acetyltransferase n=1 Tax=Desulfosediminicola ganghwensis TaxID=2569540 RepID=UPI00142EF45D|nr:GNAT family N-acetyltransferase [Desulfosediminicola ganghwensis]
MISKANNDQSLALAKLHLQTIDQGFLAKLGQSFLKSLYSFLINRELVLVYEEEGQIQGFISSAVTSSGIMKRFALSSPIGLLKILMVLLRKPFLLKALLETFRAPSLSQAGEKQNGSIKFPETELLSIAVDSEVQQGGVGAALISALEGELRGRGVVRYKVIAGGSLKAANRFYKKNGFVLAKQISIHDDSVSNVYVKELGENG